MTEALAAKEDKAVIAVVSGTPFTDLPEDLFIPPDALEVLLDSFTGPLDLLLYLIRKQNIDILDIPMRLITQQYIQYIALMKERRLELAADYLLMAAMLAEIKSRMLLPPKVCDEEEGEEEDPRLALVKRLQLYEQFKEAAKQLDELPRCERDVYPVRLNTQHIHIKQPEPDVELNDLLAAMQRVLQVKGHREHHQIARETLSVRERMSAVLDLLQTRRLAEFSALFSYSEGKMGVVVAFLAILELSKQSMLVITQTSNFAPIHIKVAEDE
jgi:segregation and condensation protein A